MKKLMLIGVALTLFSCGADEKEAGDCTTDGVTVDILENHRTQGGDHKLTISAADVVAGEEKTYDIRGDNTGHTHSVTVTADNFSSLQDGDSVTIESSDLGAAGNDHTHDVVLSCT